MDDAVLFFVIFLPIVVGIPLLMAISLPLNEWTEKSHKKRVAARAATAGLDSAPGPVDAAEVKV